MERDQNSASSKRSPEDDSDTQGSSDNGVLIPVQLETLYTLAAFFTDGPISTNIEQQLKKDLLLSGFMEDYYDRGPELLTEQEAIFRGSLGKFTRNKGVKISVGDEAIMPHGSGKTNIDETTSVDDMLEELDDASDELDDGEPDDDETDDDELDDGEPDDDEPDDGEPDDDELDVLVPDTPSHIQLVMNDPFLKPLAGKIANDGDLNEISLELLKTLQNGDAQQHCVAVDQFWENEHFRKELCEAILEVKYVMSEMSGLAIEYIAERPGEKLDRTKKDSSFQKVLDEKDHVVKMSGILGIIIGYWIKIDMLVELAKELRAKDTISPILRRDLASWLNLREMVEMSREPGTYYQRTDP